MRRGLWLFPAFLAWLSGNAGLAAGFAMADDLSRSKAAPATSGNPSSAESTAAGGAADSWRLVRSTAAAAGTGAAAAVLHTADIERSDPRLAGLMLRRDKQASKR